MDAYAYDNRGNAYFKNGEYDKAIADFIMVLQAAEQNIDLNNIFTYTLFYINRIYSRYPYLKITDTDKNKVNFQKQYSQLTASSIAASIKRAEQVRFTLGARGKAIMEQALYLYYAGVDFETHLENPAQTFAYSESLRSRDFLEQTGTQAALSLRGVTDDERKQVASLTQEIQNSRNVIDQFHTKPPENQAEETSFLKANQALDTLEPQLATLDATIGNRVPQYALLRNFKPVSMTDAQ
jgi:hypothetical protein